MSTKAETWAYWKAAIAADVANEPLPPIMADKPQVGFYYSKASKDGGKIPACIYDDKNGDRVIRLGTKAEYTLQDATARWTWVADRPVSREDYVVAWETEVWPDGSPTRAPDLPRGSNLPTDPFERLQAEVDDKLEQAKALLESLAAKTPAKVDADKARNIQADLLIHKKTADDMHEIEKAPHLEACRDVDKKFSFRKTVEDVSKQLRTFYSNWAAAEEQRLRAEAQKKFEAERAAAEAERQRILAEREKLRQDDPISALTSDEPELPAVPTGPAAVKVNVGGGVGRAAGLKSDWDYELLDYEAAVNHYRNHRDIKAAVEKLIKAQVKLDKDAANIPGVRVIEKRVAA
jgi:hypothetical protein